jgi:hypothetical protein
MRTKFETSRIRELNLKLAEAADQMWLRFGRGSSGRRVEKIIKMLQLDRFHSPDSSSISMLCKKADARNPGSKTTMGPSITAYASQSGAAFAQAFPLLPHFVDKLMKG